MYVEFFNSFSSARSRIFLFQIFNYIISCKKLYGKQPIEFIIAEHIFLEKSDPSFLKSSFLKARLYRSQIFR